LVRVQTKDQPASQSGSPGLDSADARVAVFDRARKLTLLLRTAHALLFAGRHTAVKDERLGTTTDRTVLGAHQYFAGSRFCQLLVA
jgi:hypothetical protein